MTDDQGWRQQPQYPPQGYGQQQYPPQGQPWQPQQYDPQVHRQRLGQAAPWNEPRYGRQAPYPPQGPARQQPRFDPPSQGHWAPYGQPPPPAPSWEQPGYSQPPPPSRPPHRRSRSSARWPLYAGLGVLLFVAATGITLLARHGDTATSPAAAAKPETCKQQYAAWRTGPAKPGGVKLQDDAKALSASDDDIKVMSTELQAIGADATALQAHPMPKCADPAGYWHQYLTAMTAAGDNAGSASGLGGLLLAEAPLKNVSAIQSKLTAELKRTTAH